MADFKKVTTCRVCGSDRLRKYLDLGSVPLCNNLLSTPSKSKEYPVEVLLCGDCALSQLSIVVDPKILYTNYSYHSSVSETFKIHCYEMAVKLKEFEFDFTYNEKSMLSRKVQEEQNKFRRVIDIASNDGCLLREFSRAGNYLPFGVEPAENFKTDYSKELTAEDMIPTVNVFWSETCLDNMDAAGSANFIIAQNVFAHVDNLGDFLKGVHKNLCEDGIFVIEVPYLLNLIKQNQFDTIYHEHLSYFLLKPLTKLFSSYGLPIFKVEEYKIHGGSIRVYASKNKRATDGSVSRMVDLERDCGMYNFRTYFEFSERVNETKQKFKTFLELIHRSDKKIMCYGASAKGISLLNYCGIPKKYIHSIVDDTPDKQGKFTPGSGIPIVDFSHFEKEKPDFMLLLAWNWVSELKNKTPEHKKRGGSYIVPIPEFKLV